MPNKTGLEKFWPSGICVVRKAPGICLLKTDITSGYQPHTYTVHAPSQLPTTHPAVPGWLLPPPGGRCRVCTCHLAEATSAPPPCPVTQGNCLCGYWLLPEFLKSRQRVLIEAYLFHFTR